MCGGLASAVPGSMPAAQPVCDLPEELKVLLVDDEQLSRCVVGNLLRKCGYIVTVCDSGAGALDILRRSPPGTFQLILTDVMMPEVDGLDILRYVRSNPQLADLPVIMMSANEQKDTVFQAIKGGAEEYLVKPVTKKEVQNIWQYVWKRLSAAQQPQPASVADVPAQQQLPAAVAQVAAAAAAAAGPSQQQQQQQAKQPELLQSMHRQQQSAAQQPEQQLLPGALPGGSSSSSNSAVLLSQWLQRPRRVANPKASTWLFCEVLLLLQRMCTAAAAPAGNDSSAAAAAAAATLPAGLIRPSRLLLHNSGRFTATAGAAADAQEELLYQSPEEAAAPGGAGGSSGSRNAASSSTSCASKASNSARLSYSLGVLLFDLLYVAPAGSSRSQALQDLRRGVLPASFQQQQQQEAALILALVHPDAGARPSVADLLACELLAPHCAALQDRYRQQQRQQQQQQQQQQRRSPAAVQPPQQQAQGLQQPPLLQQQPEQQDGESLLFFLQTLQDKKQGEVQQVQQEVADLDSQIALVQAALQQVQHHQQQHAGAPGGSGSAPLLCAPGSSSSPSCLATADAAGAPGLLLQRVGSGVGETPGSSGGPAAAAAAAAAHVDAEQQRGRDGQQQQQQQQAAAAMDVNEDDDDSEMERRERSRHKRRRVGPAPGQQQQQLLRLGSANSSMSAGPLDAAAVAAAADEGGAAALDAAAAAAAAGSALPCWQNAAGKFTVLESLYNKHKQRWSEQQQQQEPGAAAVAGGSSSGGSGKNSSSSNLLPGFLGSFEDDLWSFSRYSRLAVRGTVRAGSDVLGGGSSSTMICAAGFDRDDEFVATAGVSKRIRIFEYRSITSTACGGTRGCAAGAPGGGGGGAGFGGGLQQTGSGGSGSGGGVDGVVYPVLELSSRSRLSCVAWSSYVKAQLASSDYEGVVQLWDANTGSELMQLEEHSKRAWAVDFSRLEPTRLVSSSDDGTVKLWSIHQDSSVATLSLHANVCSVQFSQESPHLLAAGCANYRVYLYDLRRTAQPLACVPGHRRAVSYVRWLTGSQLVTASTDSTLKLWSVPAMAAASSTASGSAASKEAAAAACLATYTGHCNERNFIGLAVLPGAPGSSSSSSLGAGPAAGGSSLTGSGSGGGGGGGGSLLASAAAAAGGYIVCGSETNEVYAYHSSVPVPIASHSFSQQPLLGPGGGRRGLAGDLDDLGEGGGAGADAFVSCVAWNKRAGTIVAGNSAGHVQVLELV